MTDAPIFELPLLQIVIPDNRARELDPVWAEALAGLMKSQGQITPISVRKINDSTYRLVSGLHRHEAQIINGSDRIKATLSEAATDDQERLEEVMENLGRNELNALDRCHHLYELKQVYERMYPQAKRGGDRGNQHTGGKPQSLRLGTDEDAPEVFGFAKATAEKIGLAERTIQLAVKIWSGLTPDSRKRLVGTPLAQKQSELRLLSAQKKVVQGRVLDLLLSWNAHQSTVQEALDHLNKVQAPSDMERKFQVLANGIGKLADPDFDRIILQNEERIIATLKRQGRI